MSFVNAQFVLPSVTQANGSIGLSPWPRPAGRCPVTIKKRVQYSAQRFSTSRRSSVIRPKAQVYPPLGNFFSTILGVAKGAVKGFAEGGVVGAAGGGIAGGIGSGGTGGKAQQVAAQPAGPLANVTTSTLVVGGLAFSALILTLARGGR